MKKMIRRMFALLLCAAMLSTAAYAAGGQVTYDGHAQEFIFAPGSEYSPTDLFPNLKGLMPGDCITEQVTVKTDTKSGMITKIYMRALGATEGDLATQAQSEALLEQLTMTVSKNSGSDKLFEAPANETAQLTDWVLLGTFAPGAQVVLDVTANIPLEMGNEFQDAVGYLDWQFKVEETPVPETGDDMNIVPYVVMMCVCAGAVVILLVVAKKRRKEETER